MILVTGTKRSGTSLWMQILAAAGFPHLGDAFPGPWERSIRDANPNGFYESRFRQGLFYATNPDPRTGEFLFPQAVERHVVKVFVPGLVRTDYAYIGRVVATMRHWRSYGPSLSRLYALEDEYLAAHPQEGKTGEETVAWARAHRSTLPPPVEWFLENYDLVRDVATRRYAVNLCTYEALLADPERVVTKVLGWLGGGEVQAALGVIEPKLHRTVPDASDPGLDPKVVEVFDELHAAIHETQRLSPALLERLNLTWQRLEEEYGGLSRDRGRDEARNALEAADG